MKRLAISLATMATAISISTAQAVTLDAGQASTLIKSFVQCDAKAMLLPLKTPLTQAGVAYAAKPIRLFRPDMKKYEPSLVLKPTMVQGHVRKGQFTDYVAAYDLNEPVELGSRGPAITAIGIGVEAGDGAASPGMSLSFASKLDGQKFAMLIRSNGGSTDPDLLAGKASVATCNFNL